MLVKVLKKATSDESFTFNLVFLLGFGYDDETRAFVLLSCCQPNLDHMLEA